MSVFEQAKGKVKEAVGDLTDNEALKTEGEAQVDKGYEEAKETEAKARGVLTALAHASRTRG